MGVGDGVTVGVRVGNSVGVGDVTGIPSWAVCVNAAATVWAMVVLMRFGSRVGIVMLDDVHAREAINKMATTHRIGFSFNIFSYFRETRIIIIPKTMVNPLPYERFSGNFVPHILGTHETRQAH
jgi:hypothetical protein